LGLEQSIREPNHPVRLQLMLRMIGALPRIANMASLHAQGQIGRDVAYVRYI